MTVNKVEINGEAVIDLTGDSVSEDTLLEGYTAHNRSGELIVGKMVRGVTSVNGSQGDVVISGRNILLNSLDPVCETYGSSTAIIEKNVTVSEWNATDAIRVHGTGGTSNLVFYLTNNAGPYRTIPQGDYVISIYVKNNGNTDIQVGRTTFETVSAGDQRKLTLLRTSNAGTLVTQIQFGTLTIGDAFDFTFWHPMIELGNVATGWTPAPEDKLDKPSGMNSAYDIANFVLQAVCPSNEMVLDDAGRPSVMVKIPKQTYAQLGLGTSTEIFPAFKINGEYVDSLYIGKFEATIENRRAYSLPGKKPESTISFNDAFDACKAKGPGWHLMTALEWSLIALWCKANQTIPKGNTDYGKDVSENTYIAIPTTQSGGQTNDVATGTGPLSWGHDGTLTGIWDLNGNIWERVGGVRYVYGELQVLADNDAADNSKSQLGASELWKAIDANGNLIKPNGSGTTPNAIRADYVNDNWVWTTGELTGRANSRRKCRFENVSADSTVNEGGKLFLQSLGMLKVDDSSEAYEGIHFSLNNGLAEGSIFRGGSYAYPGESGIFAVSGNYARTYTSASIGFRVAYAELPGLSNASLLDDGGTEFQIDDQEFNFVEE